MILKKFMLAAAGVAAALALAGCSSFTAADNLNNVQIAPKSSPDTYQAHIHAEVWGIYLTRYPFSFARLSKRRKFPCIKKLCFAPIRLPFGCPFCFWIVEWRLLWIFCFSRRFYVSL